MANLSRNTADKPKYSVGKGIIFICLLSGTITWMAYRASLTSELSTQRKKWPFDSFEELLDTDYKYGHFTFFTFNPDLDNLTKYNRLNTAPRGNSLAETFASAAPGTIYEKVLHKNMDETSFMKKKPGLRLLLGNEKLAYYILLQNALDHTEFYCKVIIDQFHKFFPANINYEF